MGCIQSKTIALQAKDQKPAQPPDLGLAFALFFSFNLLTFSFIWILLLIALVVVMIVSFYRISPLAALLQIPYLIWLLFAAYLNLGFVILN